MKNKTVNEKLNQISKLLIELDDLDFKLNNTVIAKIENIKEWAEFHLG